LLPFIVVAIFLVFKKAEALASTLSWEDTDLNELTGTPTYFPTATLAFVTNRHQQVAHLAAAHRPSIA